jgi:hypothetical protein
MRYWNRSLPAAAMLVGICLWMNQPRALAQAVKSPIDAEAPDTASLLISGGAQLPPAQPGAAPTAAERDMNAQLLRDPPHETQAEQPECCGWGSMFVNAEYQLLQPRRRALDYVIVSGTNDGTAQGPVDTLGLQTASGVRVGGGYQTPDSHWQLGAYYTYLHTQSTAVAGAPPNGALYSTLTQPGFISLVSSAAAATSLNYQVFDLEVARRYPMSDNGNVRIFGGARFAWIDQSLTAYYDGISANQAVVSSPETFFGAGLRVGADGQWAIFRGLGFYGRAAASLLSGNFTTAVRETNNANATTLTNVTENYNKMVPIAELGLGLSWERGNVRARVGYEMINWFGLVDSPDMVHDFSNKLDHRYSDLGLQGMVVQVQWTY